MIWLVRHGETEWSRDGRHTSRTDLELTAHGRSQAAAVGRLLQGHEFARVLCSPSRRARETAQLTGLQAEIEDDLREIDYGDYEGLTTPEIRESVPGWTVFTHDMPGGETLDHAAARAERVIWQADGADGDVLLSPTATSCGSSPRAGWSNHRSSARGSCWRPRPCRCWATSATRARCCAGTRVSSRPHPARGAHHGGRRLRPARRLPARTAPAGARARGRPRLAAAAQALGPRQR